MKTRGYISKNGNHDGYTSVSEYNPNEEEWYQEADKNKIEGLIYDLKQGKTVINTGCSNECTGTCKITCGGTAVS